MSEDQRERASELFLSNDPKIIREITYREKSRAQSMLSILDQIKTPSKRNVGLDGSRAIWLIALHNWDFKNAGRIVLRKMQRLFYSNQSQVFYPGIPYLVDRIMVASKGFDHNAKQLYGTQGWQTVHENGHLEHGIFPIIQLKNLAERRRKFGLAYSSRQKTKCKHTYAK